MRFLAAFIGFFLLSSLSDAAVVQRRTYRNTEEILVPVAIIHDGEVIKELPDAKETNSAAQSNNLRTSASTDDTAPAVDEEPKLAGVEADAPAQAQRRIDEAVLEEEIQAAVQEEQDKEAINAALLQAEEPAQTVSLILSENNEALEEPNREVEQSEQLLLDNHSGVLDTQTPTQGVVVAPPNNESPNNAAEQPNVVVRQATQATPTQSTTQQNFVQQLIQNSPLGQFFNQITGQTTQSQVASDETAPAPGLFNPVTAVQNAAQSVVNSTTQAFQGLQQFASNLGNQFQSTLSGLGGQQQDQGASDATTVRPGPIQQLVNTFIGNPQQPAPSQPGPLQGLFNIFQGNNRPQTTASSTSQQPAKEPEIQESEQTPSNAAETSNDVRDSGESDSFEESIQPGELIVVNDDIAPIQNEEVQQTGYGRK